MGGAVELHGLTTGHCSAQYIIGRLVKATSLWAHIDLAVQWNSKPFILDTLGIIHGRREYYIAVCLCREKHCCRIGGRSCRCCLPDRNNEDLFKYWLWQRGGGDIYFTLSWSRLRPLSMFALLLFSADAGAFAETTSAHDHLSVILSTRGKNGNLGNQILKCNKDSQSTFII